MQITVCSEAPNFSAAAVMANGEINEDFQLTDYKGKYILLFFTHWILLLFVLQKLSLTTIESKNLRIGILR